MSLFLYPILFYTLPYFNLITNPYKKNCPSDYLDSNCEEKSQTLVLNLLPLACLNTTRTRKFEQRTRIYLNIYLYLTLKQNKKKRVRNTHRHVFVCIDKKIKVQWFFKMFALKRIYRRSLQDIEKPTEYNKSYPLAQLK